MSARGKRTLTLLIVGAVLLAVGLGFAFKFDWLPRQDLTKEIFGGPENRKAFATAQSATAQRLYLPKDDEGGSPVNNLRGPEIAVPLTTLTQLQRLFQKQSSFNWSRFKACYPTYAVLFNFHARSGDVRLALCFECNQFALLSGGAVVNRMQEFDAIRPQLLGLVKPLFPNDPKIQLLK